MSEFRVSQAKRFPKEINVPGDKSISHRSAMLAGLADGTCTVSGFLASEDCLSTVECMKSLGVRIEPAATAPVGGTLTFRIQGGGMKLSAPKRDLDCGNSGTTMRLLSGILAGQPFESRMIGDASLSRRPMKRVIDPLSTMGATIEAEGANGSPPLRLHGRALSPTTYTLPVASAQVKSAILLAGLFADGTTTVIEPQVTRDHTETMLRYFGVATKRDGDRVSIVGRQVPQARDFHVPGDISSAAFWCVAAAAISESNLTLPNVGLNSTRTGVLAVLKRMGARITTTPNPGDQAEPIGTVCISGGELHGTIIAGDEIPNVIDELPILAVAAALATGTTIIRDAQELRVKESDRLAAVAHHLKEMGASVIENPDGLEITGGRPLRAARLDSHGDHRIAMAFAIAGLFVPSGETIIENVDCVNTSYPGFATHLALFQ